MADPTGPGDELAQTGASEDGTTEPGVPAGAVRVVRQKRSMWDDRVVRTMAFGAVSLVILFLVTIISALYFGFIGGEPAPRTALEREVMAWESVTRSLDTSATAEQWQNFTLALITDSQLQRAQQVIAEVNAKPQIDQSQGANMLYCTGVLQSAQGNDDQALDTFAEVMEITLTAYEEELNREDDGTPNWAMATGLHDNYYFSALDRARILRVQERWSEGIEMLDLYLADHPQAAGVFADRAYLKAQAGDVAGAEEDYREALRFVSDMPEALEGLREIGVEE